MSSAAVLIPPAASYASDPFHTTFGFEVRHNGVSTYKSWFKEATATLRSDGASVSIEGSAKVESIDITLPPFREHVLSEGFLDAAGHPEITFASTAVRPGEAGLEVDGVLTIRGIAQPVVATGTLSAAVANPFGGTVVGLALSATIDRNAFGIEWNMPLPGGGHVLDDTVTIVVEGELVAEA
jgi:polyisoprenoid-binding protein YceI